MAGFETIVRPFIFPNIRPAPAPARVPAADDDPEQGRVVIGGTSAGTITVSYNYQASIQRASSRETRRRSDEVRVYQQDASGNINRENYVDIQVANKLWMEDEDSATSGPPAVADYSFTPAEVLAGDHSNIEVRQRNVIIENPE